jgi:hypothetical protein
MLLSYGKGHPRQPEFDATGFPVDDVVTGEYVHFCRRCSLVFVATCLEIHGTTSVDNRLFDALEKTSKAVFPSFGRPFFGYFVTIEGASTIE